MARNIYNEKRISLIKATGEEVYKIGDVLKCHLCGEYPKTGVHVACLNTWLCKECLDVWYDSANAVEINDGDGGEAYMDVMYRLLMLGVVKEGVEYEQWRDESKKITRK